MEWIIRSVRTIPWRRSLTAGFDGIVLAALTVVAADVLFSPAVGALGGSGVLIAAGCAVAFSVVFAVLVQPLFWVIHLSVASVHARRSLAGITCAILALVPLLGPVLQLALKPGPMLFVLGGTGITAAIAAFTAVRISRCPGGVAISFLAGVRAVMAVADALDLSRRIRADVVGLPLLLFVVLMLALPVLAYVAGNAFDAVLRTERRSRLNFLFAGAGLILAVVTPRLFIGQYPALRLAAMGAAFVCLLPAVTGLSLFVGIRLRAGIGVIGLGGLGLLAVLPVTSPVPWSLSGQTVVTRSLLECSGFSALRFSELWNSLAEQQGAADGRQEDLSAQKWNQEPRSEVKVRNVILLTVDSIRYDHVGYSGLAHPLATPALDRFAQSATRFHNVYAQGGWTGISVPSFLWSRHPSAIRFKRLYADENNTLHDGSNPSAARLKGYLSPDEEASLSLAGAFSAAGWQTACVANDRQTLAFDPAIGFARGFKRIIYPRAVLHDSDSAVLVTDEESTTLAIQTLEELSTGPFFLWIHLFGAHGPPMRLPGPDDLNAYQRAVLASDGQVDRLIKAVDRLGLAETTVIALSSDHGEALGEHGQYHHGLCLWEVCMRVPLLIRIPGHEGMEVELPVGLVDLGPTLLQLADISVPESMQGFSLAGLWAPEGKGPQRPIIMETWAGLPGDPGLTRHLLAIRDGSKKVILGLVPPSIAFHDLEADPAEEQDLLGIASGEVHDDFLRLGSYLVGHLMGRSVYPLP